MWLLIIILSKFKETFARCISLVDVIHRMFILEVSVSCKLSQEMSLRLLFFFQMSTIKIQYYFYSTLVKRDVVKVTVSFLLATTWTCFHLFVWFFELIWKRKIRVLEDFLKQERYVCFCLVQYGTIFEKPKLYMA